jgi:hypothetical protein
MSDCNIPYTRAAACIGFFGVCEISFPPRHIGEGDKGGEVINKAHDVNVCIPFFERMSITYKHHVFLP